MRGALASFLIQGIRSATGRWTTKKRNNNLTIWLMVIGFGSILALALNRNFNIRGLWSKMKPSITKLGKQRIQTEGNEFNKEKSVEDTNQPSFFDGLAIQDVENLIEDPTTQKEVR